MTHAKAKVIFATHMQAARSRKLSAYEKDQLSKARQVLRQTAKPAMNPKKVILEWKEVSGRISRREYNSERAAIRDAKGYNRIGIDARVITPSGDKWFAAPRRNAKRAKSNPEGVLIYGEVQRIYAKKTQDHICDAECKATGHRYYHDFTSKPRMYGLPNGDLLIKSR